MGEVAYHPDVGEALGGILEVKPEKFVEALDEGAHALDAVFLAVCTLDEELYHWGEEGARIVSLKASAREAATELKSTT